MRHLINFARSQEGAVTVDWVVLTAMAIALMLLSTTSMGDAIMSLVNNLQGAMTSAEVQL